MKCYSKRAYHYLDLELASATFDPNNNYEIPFRCNCLPRCNSIEYLTEAHRVSAVYSDDTEDDDSSNKPLQVSSGMGFRSFAPRRPPPTSNYLHEASINSTFESDTGTSIHFSEFMVAVEFKEQYFLPLRRASLYGISDFIANCGGLLGVFMGVSVLSVIEVVYFFTVRYMSERRRARN